MKNQTRIKYVAKYTVTQINKNFRGKLWAPRIRKTILKSIWVSSDKEAKDHVKKLKESGGLLDMYRPDDLIKLDPQVEGKVMVIRVKEVSIGYV